MRFPFWARALVLPLALGVGSEAWAETKVGFRQVTSTHPVAVQRGTEAEVKLRSNFTLDGTYGVYFAQPGVEMTYAEGKEKAAPRASRSSVGTPFKFQVAVPENQLPGMYEYRVATEQAVSSVAQLLVTDYPVVGEAITGNDAPKSAQLVTLPVAVCGTVEKFEDVDYYRFALKKGEEVTCEIFAQRVTDRIHNMVVSGPRIYLMDAILTLIAPSGQVVAQNDNFHGGDSFLHFQATMDGEYLLEVRDARYAGNDRYTYCVEIAQRPYIHTVYPLAVAPGAKVQAEAVGHMLGDAKASFTAPSDVGAHRVRVQTSAGETNPATVVVSSLPLVEEREPNNACAAATPISFPQGINGRLESPDDADFYGFEAKQGEKFLFEIEARRHGSPLDSILEIQDAQGKVLAEADDSDIYRDKDSQLAWTAPADGNYCVVVRDLHARGGSRYVYLLRAERPEPDFQITGEYYYAMLAPGMRTLWFVKLERLNGFTGPVTLEVQGLPEGVTYEPITMPPGVTDCGLILEAAKDAPIGAALVGVYGKASMEDPDGKPREIVRRGLVKCEQQNSGGGQNDWPIETQIVGVTKPLDLTSVTAEPGELTLKPGETKEITVRIERQAGFDDAVTLSTEFKYLARIKAPQLPRGVTMSPKSKARLSGKVLEGTVVLTAADNALPVERMPIAVVAQVSIAFSINTFYATNPIYLTVLPKEPAADAKEAPKKK